MPEKRDEYQLTDYSDTILPEVIETAPKRFAITYPTGLERGCFGGVRYFPVSFNIFRLFCNIFCKCKCTAKRCIIFLQLAKRYKKR